MADNFCFSAIDVVDFRNMKNQLRKLTDNCHPKRILFRLGGRQHKKLNSRITRLLPSVTSVDIHFQEPLSESLLLGIMDMAIAMRGVARATLDISDIEDSERSREVFAALVAKFVKLQELTFVVKVPLSCHFDALHVGAPKLRRLKIEQRANDRWPLEALGPSFRAMYSLEELILPWHVQDICALDGLVQNGSRGSPIEYLKTALAQLPIFLPPKLKNLANVFCLMSWEGKYPAPLLGRLLANSSCELVRQFLLQRIKDLGIVNARCEYGLNILSAVVGYRCLSGTVRGLVKAGANPFARSPLPDQSRIVEGTLYHHVMMSPWGPHALKELSQVVDLERRTDIRTKLRATNGFTPLHVKPNTTDVWLIMYRVLISVWPDIMDDVNNSSRCPPIGTLLVLGDLDSATLAKKLIKRLLDCKAPPFSKGNPGERHPGISELLKHIISVVGRDGSGGYSENDQLIGLAFSLHLHLRPRVPKCLEDLGYSLPDFKAIEISLMHSANLNACRQFFMIMAKSCSKHELALCLANVLKNSWNLHYDDTVSNPRQFVVQTLELGHNIPAYDQSRSLLPRYLRLVPLSGERSAWDKFWDGFWLLVEAGAPVEFSDNADLPIITTRIVKHSNIRHLVKLVGLMQKYELVQQAEIAYQLVSTVVHEIGDKLMIRIIVKGIMMSASMPLWEAFAQYDEAAPTAKEIVRLCKPPAKRLLEKDPALARLLKDTFRLCEFEALIPTNKLDFYLKVRVAETRF
jgi:hypothetical protein